MKNHWSKFVLSLFVSALILWLLLNLVSNESNPITLDDFKNVLSGVSTATFLSFLAIHLLGVAFRTLRFRVLIKATRGGTVPGIWPLSLVTLVRNMTVDFLPARIGELFYVGLLNRGLGVRLDSCFSSLALSIWFDLMVIIPLVLGLVLYPILDTSIQQRMLLVSVILVVVCVIGILILYPGMGIAAAWLKRLNGSDSRWLLKLQDFVSKFADSIKRSLNRRTVLITFLLTVGVRFCKYFSITWLFTAVAAVGFPELAGADPGSIVVALLSSEAGASLPIPAFMGFGTYEAGGLAAFAMLGLPVASAGLALFTIHLITQTVDYTLGGLAFFIFTVTTRVKLSSLRTGETSKSTRQ